MANPIQSFFRKYGAVPADDASSRWSEASNEALLIHSIALRSESPSVQDRAGYRDIVAEVARRARIPGHPFHEAMKNQEVAKGLAAAIAPCVRRDN